MQCASRTAEVIEWPFIPRENPPKSRFGLRDLACVLLMLIGFVFFTTADASVTYYVSSSSGSDANAGTQAAPWRTLAKVSSSSSLFKPGDSILLKRGDTWNEQFNIKDQAGASGTPITYGAYGSGALPTVDAQQARTFGVYMNNVSHIVVGDMRTINATANGFHIVAGSGNINDVVVQRVLSERNARSGFSVEATPGVTDVDAIEYRDDEAHLNGGAGFQAYNVSEGATGVHYHTCKASYNGQTSANHGFSTYLANNIHYHGVEAAFTNIDPATGLRNAFATGGEGIGIAFDDYVSNSSVEHSYSHDNAGSGIMLTHESSNNVASYNVIARNGGIGLVVNGYSAGSSNITVLNNTIYGNKSYGMVAWKPVNGLTIKNNILVNNIGYGIGFSSIGITNYTVANNLAFGNTQGATAYVSGATGTFVADPLFAAPASGDFSLQASSPAINAGLYLGAPYSLGLMKGTIWPSAVLLSDQGAAWDIGAFVYGPQSTTLLASSANPSGVAANVTFTATVTGSAPTGSVAFKADGTTLSGCSAVALPTGTANSKTATCSTASLSVGVHSVVGSYTGNAANNSSTSAALSQVVGSKTASTTGLASSANPSAFGANVTFTATVTGSAPTGSVAFKADGTTLSGCSAVALPTGTANSKTATCSTASLSVGVHSVVGSYTGNAANNSSTSAALSQVVGSKTASTTGLASSANPSAFGANVTFTATVTGSAPTGSVAFKADGTTLSGCSAVALPTSTANSKTATCSTASLSAATHSIVGTYTGNAANNGSTSSALSQVVNIKTASTTGLASSANPSAVGANVTFTATVTGSAPTGSVAFKADGTTLSGCSAVALPTGTANSKTATCSTASLSAGTHSIVATYGGDAGNNGSGSAALSQVVKTASTTGLASSANPSVVGASVTFTATVTGSVPTGTVAFRADGTTLSGCSAVALPTGTANSKIARCSTASLSAATHSIVATYGGDAGNNGSTSAALSQVVNPALVNPSFEIPVLPSAGYQYNPSATGIGWTFSGNSGIQANGSAWGAAPAPAGTQTAFIRTTGTVRQTLNLNAGSHTLSFQAAQGSPHAQPIKVTMDGIQIGSLVSPTSTSFTAFTIPFSVATSGARTLAFTGTDPANKTTFIDAVTVQ